MGARFLLLKLFSYEIVQTQGARNNILHGRALQKLGCKVSRVLQLLVNSNFTVKETEIRL